MFKYDVSLIVPVYNSEKYIDECLESIINQKYDFNKIEVILINDGSPDNSIEICKKYSEKYPNIKLIDKKNSGVSDTRNKGIKIADGKYIMLVDSDDYISKTAIKKLVNFMDNNDVDLTAYSLMYYYENSDKIAPHFRNKMYENGTGIYDVDDYPYITQANVNIIFRNEKEKNNLFETSMNFSEDERFNTEVIMKKKKIGFVAEAKYYYRMHDNGQATKTKVNPLYCFDSIIKYYEYLFDRYVTSEGNVEPYVQGIFVNDLRWRIVSDQIIPYYKKGKEFDDAIAHLHNLIKKLDNDVIMNHPQMNTYHKIYLLKIKEAKLETIIDDEGFKIMDGDKIIDESKYIAMVISRFKIRNNKLYILGYLRSVLLQFEDPKLYVVIKKNGKEERKEIKLFESNHKKLASKMDVSRIYGLELEESIEKVQSISFEVLVNNKKIDITYEFTRYTPFVPKAKFKIRSYLYKDKRISYIARKGFKFEKATFKNRIKTKLPRFLYTLLKEPSALIYRSKAKKYKDKEIWLYCDRAGLKDNAYIQFKHDIKINDGIDRYYIFDGDEIDKEMFDESELKNVILKKDKKAKVLQIASSKILTSFSTVNEYSQYPYKSFKYYSDIKKYDLVYLQHGVLFANLIKMYGKEFTEIDKIIISSEFEKKNLINNYKYNEKDLILTGMPRFEKEDTNVEKVSRIILAPSWRKYLIQDPPVNGERKPFKELFLASKFYNEINALINDKELNKLLKESDVQLDLKLHPIFKDYNECFKTDCSNIHVVEDKVNELAYSLLITDFSSYQFDFAKLGTPMIYFIPDREEFDAGLHTYRELDLPLEEGFGDVVTSAKELKENIEYYIKNNFKAKKVYKDRMSNFFVKEKNITDKIYKALMKKD